MAQHEVQVGSKKSGFTLVVDDAPVPSRGASQETRARWAVGYVRRIRKGETLSVKLLDQAIKWIDEVVCEAFGRQPEVAAPASRGPKQAKQAKAPRAKAPRAVSKTTREYVIRHEGGAYFDVVRPPSAGLLDGRRWPNFVATRKTAARFPTREAAEIEILRWPITPVGFVVEPIAARKKRG